MGKTCSCIERRETPEKNKPFLLKEKIIRTPEKEFIRSQSFHIPESRDEAKTSISTLNHYSTIASIDLRDSILDEEIETPRPRTKPVLKVLSPVEKSLIHREFPIRVESESFYNLPIKTLLKIVFSEQEITEETPINNPTLPPIETIGSKICYRIIFLLTKGESMYELHHKAEIHLKLLQNLDTFNLNLLVWTLAVLDLTVTLSTLQNVCLEYLKTIYLTPEIIATLNNLILIQNEYSRYWVCKLVVSLAKLSEENIEFLMEIYEGKLIKNCIRSFSAFNRGNIFYEFSLVLKDLLYALPLSDAYKFTSSLKLHVNRRSKQLSSTRKRHFSFERTESYRELSNITTKLLDQIREFCEEMTYIKYTKNEVDENRIEELNCELNTLQKLSIENLIENLNSTEELFFELNAPYIACLNTKGALFIFEIYRIIREKEEIVQELKKEEDLVEKLYENIGCGYIDLENTSIVLLERIGSSLNMLSEEKKERLVEKLTPLLHSEFEKVKYGAFSLIESCEENKQYTFHKENPKEFLKMFEGLKDIGNPELYCKQITIFKNLLNEEEEALNLLREEIKDWEDIIEDSAALISIHPQYLIYEESIEESKKELIDLFLKYEENKFLLFLEMGNNCSCVERATYEAKGEKEEKIDSIESLKKQKIEESKKKRGESESKPTTVIKKKTIKRKPPEKIEKTKERRKIKEAFKKQTEKIESLISLSKTHTVKQELLLSLQNHEWDSLNIESLLQVISFTQISKTPLKMDQPCYCPAFKIGSQACYRIFQILQQGISKKYFHFLHKEKTIHIALIFNLETSPELAAWTLTILDFIFTKIVDFGQNSDYIARRYLTGEFLNSLSRVITGEDCYSIYWSMRTLISLLRLGGTMEETIMNYQEGVFIAESIEGLRKIFKAEMIYQYSHSLKKLMKVLPLTYAHQFYETLWKSVAEIETRLKKPNQLGRYINNKKEKEILNSRIIRELIKLRYLCDEFKLMEQAFYEISEENYDILSEYFDKLHELEFEGLIEELALTEKFKFELEISEIGVMKTSVSLVTYLLIRKLTSCKITIDRLVQETPLLNYCWSNLESKETDIANYSLVLLSKILYPESKWEFEFEEELLEICFMYIKHETEILRYAAFYLIRNFYCYQSFSLCLEHPQEFKALFYMLENYHSLELVNLHLKHLYTLIKFDSSYIPHYTGLLTKNEYENIIKEVLRKLYHAQNMEHFQDSIFSYTSNISKLLYK